MNEREFELKQILQHQYGIKAESIINVEGGWAALAYKAVDNHGGTYFLKAYEKTRTSTPKWTRLIDVYAPIVMWLNQNTNLKGKIPEILLTMSQKYKCEDDNCIYMLYAYIQGKTIGEKVLTKRQISMLSKIVSELHKFDRNIPFDTRDIEEDFDTPFANLLTQTVSGLHQTPEYFEAFIKPYKEMIMESGKELEQLSAILRKGAAKKVLCHMDIHNWNLMQSNHKIVLIDWEGLKLAPVESDIMFVSGEDYFEQFLQIYRKEHKDYEIDPSMLNFYKLRRLFEDIWEGAEQLLFDSQNEDKRSETIRDVVDMLEDLKNLGNRFKLHLLGGTQASSISAA